MPELAKKHGHIPGCEPGDRFDGRRDAFNAGVHGHIRWGIHGASHTSAYSICLSGAYPDNKYSGDKITYVGTGGRTKDGQQAFDQSFENYMNKSLQNSCKTKLPVRVLRASSKKRRDLEYTYEGLYVVDSAAIKPGKEGKNMCFYELSRLVEPADDNGAGPSHSGGHEEDDDDPQSD